GTRTAARPAGRPTRSASAHPAQTPYFSGSLPLFAALDQDRVRGCRHGVRDLGFDGCDMAVVPGSHVAPEQANADLMRAIEAVSGVGLEVPIISTSIVSPNDPYGR